MPPPHVLVMSATPIPRTLALILYGDLDLSVIDELPPGRTPVATYVVGEDKRRRVYNFVRRQVEQAMQGTDDGELKRRMAELTNALQAVGRYTDNSAADDADGAVDADFSDSHEEKH